jgi:bifunctional pyridoxal-dependent enzyme with beta-cystathionase and maltose regulon repressor activities
MDPAEILALINAGSQVIGSAVKAYASIKATASLTDQTAIEAALAAASAQYETDFARVDAELAGAST